MLCLFYKAYWFMTDRIYQAMRYWELAPVSSNGGTVR